MKKCMYIYIYISISLPPPFLSLSLYLYIYIYREREGESEIKGKEERMTLHLKQAACQVLSSAFMALSVIGLKSKNHVVKRKSVLFSGPTAPVYNLKICVINLSFDGGGLN